MRICTLASGSSGNAILVEEEQTAVLVDAGLSGKRVEQCLNAVQRTGSQLAGVIVTHEHVDHIKGVGIMSRRYKLPVMATAATWDAMEEQLGKIAPEHRVIVEKDQGLDIGDLKCELFGTRHDAADPIGLTFYGKQEACGILTDTGSVYAGMKKYLSQLNTIICEANHDEEMLMLGSYPWSLKQRVLSDHGHLSNRMAGKILAKLIPTGVEDVVLAHLSEENNTPRVARRTVEEILEEAGITPGVDVNLTVAPRHSPGPIIAKEA